MQYRKPHTEKLTAIFGERVMKTCSLHSATLVVIKLRYFQLHPVQHCLGWCILAQLFSLNRELIKTDLYLLPQSHNQDVTANDIRN